MNRNTEQICELSDSQIRSLSDEWLSEYAQTVRFSRDVVKDHASEYYAKGNEILGGARDHKHKRYSEMYDKLCSEQTRRWHEKAKQKQEQERANAPLRAKELEAIKAKARIGILILFGLFIAHSIVFYIILTNNPQLFRMPFANAPLLIEYIMMMFGPLFVFVIIAGAIGKALYSNPIIAGFGMMLATIVLYIMLEPGMFWASVIVFEVIRIIFVGGIVAVIGMAIGIGIGEMFKHSKS